MSNDEQQEERKAMAEAIVAQLGGRRFIAMTGANNFVYGDNYLQFCLPQDEDFVKSKINKVKIVLDVNDTYTMSFLVCDYENKTSETIAEENDLYADMLQTRFKENTGLDTHL